MRLLETSETLHSHFARLVKKATAIDAAVAWASIGFQDFDLLVKNRKKLRRILVGLHFHQTHPEFIQTFLADQAVRFIKSLDGTFHPKIYFFEMEDQSWECIIGSPNFTRSAFEANTELAVLVDNNDSGSDSLAQTFKKALEVWWQDGKWLSVEELESYRQQWMRVQAMLPRISGKFGKPTSDGLLPDGGAAVTDIPICIMTWNQFLIRVRKERDSEGALTLKRRLQVISIIREVFHGTPHLYEMTKEDRYKVAGLLQSDGVDFLWFGSMRGAGRFKHLIKENNLQISQALDIIPPHGEIKRNIYLLYIEQFEQAFSNGGHGIATASRLLAMKRPDVFICLDSANRTRLCKAFKISQKVDYEGYWDSVIERIRESTWWNTIRPNNDEEAAIWDARAAMLDSLFYED